MSTVTLVDLAEGIVNRAAERCGVRPYPEVPGDINVPAVFVVFPGIERGSFGIGVAELEFELIVFVSRADQRGGQRALYGLVNPDPNDQGSLWAAFEDDRDLGLTGVNVALIRYRPLGIDEVAAYGYFGGAFEGLASITRNA